LDLPLKFSKIADLWHQPPNMVATAISFQRASSVPFPSSDAFGRVPSGGDEYRNRACPSMFVMSHAMLVLVHCHGVRRDANFGHHVVQRIARPGFGPACRWPHMSLFGRVGSSGSNGGTYGEDRLALMTQTYYYPRCSEDRLHWAQRMAAHAEERSNDKESEKPGQMDRLAQLTNAYYLPPCSQASLHKAQREAARLSNEPV
jgi:hypothetical protein